ncbi:amylase I [Penaeus vannamei]|uniref:alpha-amylase n=1 Tax=Penaeus vannamei TaxID=6689 RepID=A0A3R7QFK2_PENVA|nr:amylase I [Penaeus vannamei]
MLRVAPLVVLLAAAAQAQWDPNSSNGQVIVHLFEWKWPDIAARMRELLGSPRIRRRSGIPPTECLVAYQGDVQRPWWERYQPVSYKIVSRSGDENAFKDMITRCNNVGVRIYVDIVVNHMTGWWPAGTGSTGGSSFDSGAQSYPGVPTPVLISTDANCHTGSGDIENYGDANQVRNCKLSGMNDLNQGTDYVRGKIRDYLNTLISFGVAGFRVDASKHMWPGDMKAIFDSLDDLSPDIYGVGARPFIVQEVIDLGGEAISSEEYVGKDV